MRRAAPGASRPVLAGIEQDEPGHHPGGRHPHLPDLSGSGTGRFRSRTASVRPPSRLWRTGTRMATGRRASWDPASRTRR